MKSRRPSLDFQGLPAAWAPDAGFAAFLNAGGALAPAVEPYLNRVMREAARRLRSRHDALKAEINVLVRQETEHFKLHEAFNQALADQGYGAILPIVDALKLDLAAQFRERSFDFNLAWCVGFETFTLYLGQYLFGPGARGFEDADPRAVDLWRWHLAEEYEHRATCHAAYRALSGDYPLRLSATAHCYRLVADYRRRTLSVLAPDMHAADAFGRKVALDMAFRLPPALLPFHDPTHAAPPQGVAEALTLYPEAA